MDLVADFPCRVGAKRNRGQRPAPTYRLVLTQNEPPPAPVLLSRHYPKTDTAPPQVLNRTNSGRYLLVWSLG